MTNHPNRAKPKAEHTPDWLDTAYAEAKRYADVFIPRIAAGESPGYGSSIVLLSNAVLFLKPRHEDLLAALKLVVALHDSYPPPTKVGQIKKEVLMTPDLTPAEIAEAMSIARWYGDAHKMPEARLISRALLTVARQLQEADAVIEMAMRVLRVEHPQGEWIAESWHDTIGEALSRQAALQEVKWKCPRCEDTYNNPDEAEGCRDPNCPALEGASQVGICLRKNRS